MRALKPGAKRTPNLGAKCTPYLATGGVGINT
jgi:hypothetical protein